MESALKKAKFLMPTLWGMPSLAYIAIAFEFMYHAQMKITINGENAIPIVLAFYALLSVFNIVMAFGLYNRKKWVVYISMGLLIVSGYSLFDYSYHKEVIRYKYMVIPTYYLIVSLATIFFFRNKGVASGA